MPSLSIAEALTCFRISVVLDRQSFKIDLLVELIDSLRHLLLSLFHILAITSKTHSYRSHERCLVHLLIPSCNLLLYSSKRLLDIADVPHCLDLVIVGKRTGSRAHDLEGFLSLLKVLLRTAHLLLCLTEIRIVLDRRQDTIDVFHNVTRSFEVVLECIGHDMLEILRFCRAV